MDPQKLHLWLILLFVTVATAFLAVGCSSEPTAEKETDEHEDEAAHVAEGEVLALPHLEAVDLGGEKLKVVATTSLIGDVVAQVGGDAIELVTLIGPGQDAHSYEAAARDLTAVAGADVIFVNGWELEEGLEDTLEKVAEEKPVVPVSAGIVPLAFENGDDGHGHSTADPHVWFNINNVEQWASTIAQVLGELDPGSGNIYLRNAKLYLGELQVLEEFTESQLAQIAEEKRFLVTNHNSFGYFADAYGFEQLGTVIPAASTLAEPSASDLAALVEEMEAHGVCTLFTETAVSDTLAQTVAGELDGCEEVKVLPLYTGSVGVPGSGADSYTGMFRANVEAIVEGLR